MQHFKNILTAHSDNTDIKPNQVCVIGDRLLTDILLGNRSGMHTVLVHDVISLENDNRMAVAVGWKPGRERVPQVRAPNAAIYVFFCYRSGGANTRPCLFWNEYTIYRVIPDIFNIYSSIDF